MQLFFDDADTVQAFLSRLRLEPCPVCGARGPLTRHGYIRGYVEGRLTVMAWRVFCDPDSAAGKGCGHAPCVRLAGTLSGRCLSAACLAFFILALLAGVSVRAAWKACGTVLSLRSGYRTRARLGQCQSVLRTRVSARGPPRAERRTETAFLATLEMLTESLGRDDTVCVYQRTFQRGFLSLA